MKSESQILPNFFIIGAAKAGTTTLYDLLKQHPQVYLPFVKEPMFFSHDENFIKGVDWYSHTYFRGAEQFPAKGEATPHYLYWSEKVAPRIYETYGKSDIRFVAILRNPVDRAYSWYWNMIKEGKEELSLEEALETESDRIQIDWDNLHRCGSMTYGYFRGGCYAGQLAEFLKYFSRDQFCILLQEDLMDSFHVSMKELCIFLDVNDSINYQSAHSNPSSLPRSMRLQRYLRGTSIVKDYVKRLIPFPIRYRLKNMLIQANLKRVSYPAMDLKTALSLRSRYNQEVMNLEKIIDRDLSHWREN